MEQSTVTFDLRIPPGRTRIVSHRHAWTEHLAVREGHLDLTVSGVEHRLRPGEEMTVGGVFHQPANPSAADTVVTVTCNPGAVAERALRGAFGLARSGGIRADGRPKDLLSLALLSQAGQFQIEGPPDAVWRALIAGPALVARCAGRRRIIQGYWPPDLRSPW